MSKLECEVCGVKMTSWSARYQADTTLCEECFGSDKAADSINGNSQKVYMESTEETRQHQTKANHEFPYYGFLWGLTIVFGIIGLLIASNYFREVTTTPQYSAILTRDFQESIDRGSLLCLVLFYFYFKALGSGMEQKRHISTFIKLTIWSVFVVFAKMIAVAGLSVRTGSQIDIYAISAVAHLDALVSLGVFIFPIVTIYMIGAFIRFKLKERVTRKV